MHTKREFRLLLHGGGASISGSFRRMNGFHSFSCQKTAIDMRHVDIDHDWRDARR